MKQLVRACGVLLLAVATAAADPGDVVVLSYDSRSPQVRFAATEIRTALGNTDTQVVETSIEDARKPAAATVIILASGKAQADQINKVWFLSLLSPTTPQAYAVRHYEPNQRHIYLGLGADDTGAMYAGLDIAERIRIGSLARLQFSEHSPHIARRGIKFNIPLDARTPSYSDNSDSAQQNIAEMWSFDFWREFLDDMARHRYNVLTLWSLHPFPSIVRIPDYPDLALKDVMRTTIKLDDSYSHTGKDMVRPATLQNLEVVRKMTMEQKIQFWRDVMQYAADRGIETYWFTWNIFAFGAEGKYGISASQTNPQTVDYFRAAVRETVLTYPLLAGIGITAGEQMEALTDHNSKERWLWKTYGEGVRDALKQQPDRKFRIIHRFHQTGQSEILREWRQYTGPFDLSFKYAIAHMYSIPNPPFIQPVLPGLSPELRSWLTIRNDDIYSFRWADADYARAFIRNIPGPDKIAGFYMGPDGFNWGRDFLTTEPDTPRQTVMQKQWFSFLLWGRLSYDPKLPDLLLQQIMATRFPEAQASKLSTAWAEASRVIPEITRFSWGDIDLKWFPEACLSHPKYKGFYTVRHFMEGETMPGSGVVNILAWREKSLSGIPLEGTAPVELANSLKSHAAKALAELPELRKSQDKNKELRLTLGDIEAMAHLGNYYGEKILGAADLAVFDKVGDERQRSSAIAHLESALSHWRSYAAIYAKQYKPQLLNRVGFVDIPALIAKVEQDIQIAKAWKAGTLKAPAAKP